MTEDELLAAERSLQQAQRTGDVAALDRLLDDRLLHTGGPDGGRYTKADDLELYGSGQLVVADVVEEDVRVLVDGRAGVTWFTGTLEATFRGTPVTARLRFTRTWFYDDALGWRIVAAHASPVA